MKILQINSVYKIGSTGGIVFGIHNYLMKKNKTKSYVCYGRGERFKERNVFKISFEATSKFNHFVAKYITGAPYSGNYLATAYLIYKIMKIKPDIVHIHNLNDYYVNMYILLKYLAKRKYKTIITMHSEQYYTGTCGHSLNCSAWKNGGCKKCDNIQNAAGSKIDKTNKNYKKLVHIYSLFLTKNLFFVGCTPWLLENANESIIKKFNKSVIFNGVDEKIFYKNSYQNKNTRTKYGIPLKNKVVLFVCPRMNDPIKGYQFIPEISRMLPSNYSLLVVGKIEKAKTKGIFYCGELRDKSVISDCYNLADCTIVLSMRECFPTVIIESLQCKTPVVSFKCCGPEKAFSKNEVTFVEYGDCKKLIKEIQNSINRKKRITSTYTITEMARNYCLLYKNQS